MKTAVVAFLTCLLILCVQAQSDNRSEKCKCSGSFIGRVHSRFIKAGPFIHEPSIFCPRKEIRIITTANREKCVDPQSPLGRLIVNNSQKKNAVMTTTDPRQTLSTASTQTTSTL